MKKSALFLVSLLLIGCSQTVDNKEKRITFGVNNKDMGYLTGDTDQTITGGETISKVTAKANLGYKFVSWSDGNTSLVREDESFKKDMSITAIFDYDVLEMPILTIETENRENITSKTEYLNATASAFNTSNESDFTELALGIRGRGNYSWSGTEKKSYRVKFDKKINLFNQGLGKAKSWTLLAVHADKAMLRNHAVFDFAKRLGTLPFVSSSSYVELYLNGKYDGVYEVCDQIQVNEFRVNIDDTGSDLDIGYLVELDKNASEDVIYLDNGDTCEVKSDYVSEDQLEFITDYLDNCFDAIKSGSRESVDSLMDIPSIIDSYIVEEYFKNLDVGWGSFYFTKPKGNKLYFGPVWDFDLCSGNADDDNYNTKFKSYKYTYVGSPNFQYAMQQSKWFTELRKTSWFYDEVKTRWFEVMDYIPLMIDEINHQKDTYINSFNRNFVRWKIFNKKINREPTEVMNIKSFTGQVEYLVNWLNNRKDWLTGYFQGVNVDA